MLGLVYNNEELAKLAAEEELHWMLLLALRALGDKSDVYRQL